MDICERYRPQNYSEFVGDKATLEQVEKYVKNDVPTILHGLPGVGKTTLAYLVAKELGMQVSETNASDKRKKEDLKDIERQLKKKTLIPTLFLFEEIDGMGKSNQNQLAEIVKKTTKPILITANDYMKLDLSLKKYCKLVEVKLTDIHYRPIVKRIKEIAEKEGIKDAKYNKVNLDIRSSIRCVLESSQGYEIEENNFEKVTKIFKEKKIERIKSSNGSDVTLPWILDNLSNFYYGLDIYKAVKMLGIVAETHDLDLLSSLPPCNGGKIKYPYYLRKRSKYAKYNG